VARGPRPLEGLVVSVSFADAFRGRPVLVTGHTGFKGSWLSLWIARLGARVTGYALPPPTRPSLFEAGGVRARLTAHWEADVRDRTALRAALAEATPDVVFHLAAQPIVRRSYASPVETFDVNVLGTAVLLDAVRELGLRCAVVVVTSDKCYENREPSRPRRESDRLGGDDPYSASKAAAEIVVESYRRSYFPPADAARHGVLLSTARAGNVIGGGDWAEDRIVPDCVRALGDGQPVAVRNPRSRRPWQHVLEPLAGYLTLAAALLGTDAPRFAEAWNFGPRPDDEATVCEVVDAFLGEWGNGTWAERPEAEAPTEAARLRLSIDAAVRRLGWSPRWALAEAIRRTARWYRRHADGGGVPGAMAEACLAEIADYEAA
jgi:CDP-glucose 4,6-dehydratase